MSLASFLNRLCCFSDIELPTLQATCKIDDIFRLAGRSWHFETLTVEALVHLENRWEVFDRLLILQVTTEDAFSALRETTELLSRI
jgi:hypothetical protein